jgi:hypothetical protein
MVVVMGAAYSGPSVDSSPAAALQPSRFGPKQTLASRRAQAQPAPAPSHERNEHAFAERRHKENHENRPPSSTLHSRRNAGSLCSVLCPLSSAHAATFTTNALISEANTAFDGQDIVVSGATLTVDGRHYFNSLLLTNGAVLTHSPSSDSKSHKLDIMKGYP